MKVTRNRALATMAAAVALVAPVGLAASSPTVTSPALRTTAVSVTPSTTSAGSPYCGIYWGSLPKRSTSMTTGAVENVRSGRHTCFDRVVFDIAPGHGKVGYSVRYVSQVTSPGSGLPVSVSGGVRIQITVNAPATKRIPSTGVINYLNWSTFRQLKWVASFEGYTDFGLGVRARLPMRAFVLQASDGGQRLVVDVAHHW
jgi:hypothetical protein